MADIVEDNARHRIVITAIIYRVSHRGYEYLVTKRSETKKVFPGKWTVPGGGLEPGDYRDKPKTTDDAWYFVVEEVLRREVREEVNLEIGKPQYLLDLIFIRPDNIPVLTLSYYAPYKSGDVVLEAGDATEFRWVTYAEAKELDMISGIAEEIGLADQYLQGNVEAKINL